MIVLVIPGFILLNKNYDFYLCLLKFQEMVETQFSSKVNNFQSDGGGEFITTDFMCHLENCGILHCLSCLGAPEQDGVLEKKHRHIIEMDHSIISCLRSQIFDG